MQYKHSVVVGSMIAALAGIVPAGAAPGVTVDDNTLAREAAFRADVFLNASREHVRGVHARGDKVELYGMAFTPSEAAELTARDRTATEVTRELASLRTRMPAETFAGEYLDNATGRVVVRVTGSEAEVRQALHGAVSEDQRVAVAPAANSEVELAAVVEMLSDASVGGRRVAGVDIAIIRPDVVGNDVDVVVRGDADAARAALTAAYPGAPLDVSAGDVATTTNEKMNVVDAPPLKGGQDIRDGLGRCTSAFVAYNLIRLDAAIFTYDFFLLTAGHCGGGRTGTAFTQVAYPIGTSAANGYYNGSFVDGNAIRMKSTDRSNQVYERRTAAGVNIYRSIRSVESENASTDMVGQYVCQDGVTNNYLCGTIASKGLTANYPARPTVGLDQPSQIRDLREATPRSDGGDSGASVHSGELAKGVLSGSATYSNGDVNFIYQHVRDVLRATGVTYVKTSWNSEMP